MDPFITLPANCGDPIQETLEKAMPWVGGYIAAASAACTLLMAADVFNGFRLKKLWFPCKYFSLNATSLTLLAAAMKLPMDLTTNMLYANTDFIAKLSSLIFMSTAMGNFMSSLGSMNNKNILPNVLALGILVFTMAVDVLIQLILLRDILDPFFILLSTIWMLLLLAALVSLAITVPTTKRSLESKYQEQHKVALREEEVLKRREAFTIDNQRGYMMKYLVMAESSSPQFVMARSVVCTISAVICLLALITLAGAYALLWTNVDGRALLFGKGASPYKDFTKWILYVQTTGVAVGTIAPMMRWFAVVSFKCSTANRNSFKEGIKIETYWIQNLVEWRDSFSALRIRQDKYRKYLHDAKWFAITFCIGIQILIVLLSKLFVFLSALLISPIFLCFTHIKKFMIERSFNVITSNHSSDDKDLNLSRYVLLLEGEGELPRRVLKNICREADNMIQKGKKKQPQNLVLLLGKFVDFNRVRQFDGNQILSLHSNDQSPNCWALPVVTLTSIAIALPNTAKHKAKQLLSSVGEGLTLAKLVEKTLTKKNAQLVNIRKVADICWVGVVLYTKWLDIDLKRTSLKCKNSREVLHEFSKEAEGIIRQCKKEVQDSLMENPLNGPAKVVAANSMYRISRTILSSCEEKNKHTDKELFDQLSALIADILAACLTNLPHVITTMCHRNAIEKREKSVRKAFLLLGETEQIVRKAFLLLGETEQIVELLQQHEWPSVDHDKAASTDERSALFQENKGDPATLASTSSDVTVSASVSSSEEHSAITVDC